MTSAVRSYLLLMFIGMALLKSAHAQVPTQEQFTKEVLELKTEMDWVKLNLGQSEKRFKRGILVATIGYSVTIAGGLMLGRKNDELGKALLVAGGATGITGTFLLVDAFKFLGRASGRPPQRTSNP